MRKYFIPFIIIFSSLTFFSCSDSTSSDNNASLSGTAVINGESDHSGITISVYETIPIANEYKKLNTDYPTVGFVIDQSTEFNHFAHQAVKQTETDVNGNWKIDGLKDDLFNVVAQKDGYGWSKQFNVNGSNIILNLNSEINISGIISENLFLPQNSTIIIEGNATVPQGITVTVSPNCNVWINDNIQLEIQGSILFNGEENKKIYFHKSNGSSFYLNGSENSALTNIVFFADNIAINLSNCKSIQLEKIRIDNCISGIEIFNSKNINTDGLVLSNSEVGINSQFSEIIIQRTYTNNMINYGFSFFTELNSEVFNNLISNCLISGTGINPEGTTTGRTYVNYHHNTFENNNIHIKVGSGGTEVQANFNNFLSSTNYKVSTHMNNGIDTLNFQSNFWIYDNSIDIANSILDDNDRPPGEPGGTIVNFDNYILSQVEW